MHKYHKPLFVIELKVFSAKIQKPIENHGDANVCVCVQKYVPMVYMREELTKSHVVIVYTVVISSQYTNRPLPAEG